MKLIVGLGNPEEDYAGTRHNLGFMVLDEYARKHLQENIVWEREEKFRSLILRLTPDLWLVKPQTFVNKSGMAVKMLVDYYKVPLGDLVVVHDDLDLILGKIKIRLGGGAAGHHGVESIINELGDDKFIRVRIGIGNLKSESGERGGQHFDANNFVLTAFTKYEKPQLKQALKRGAKTLDLLLEKGLEEAQNQYN